MIPIEGMRRFICIANSKIIYAGEIVEICPAGCYVSYLDIDDGCVFYPQSVLRTYTDDMNVESVQIGDFWLVWPDGREVLMERDEFANKFA